MIRRNDASYENVVRRFGTPYKKPTRLLTNALWLNDLARLCNCGSKHSEVLSGKVKIRDVDNVKRWHWKTALAGEYPTLFCRAFAGLLLAHGPRSAHGPGLQSGFWSTHLGAPAGWKPPELSLPAKFKLPWTKKDLSWG